MSTDPAAPTLAPAIVDSPTRLPLLAVVAGLIFAASNVYGAEPIPSVRLAKPGRGYVPPRLRMPADYSFWTPFIVRAYRLEPEAAREVDYLSRTGRLLPQYREPVEAPKR